MKTLEFFKENEIKSNLISVVGGCWDTAVCTFYACGDQGTDYETDHSILTRPCR